LANHLLNPQIFFAADDGANNPGGDNGNPVIPPVTNPNPSEKEKPDFKAIAQAVVAEVLAANSVNGDQAKALEVLAGRNARLEADRDAKVEEIGRIKAQLPADNKQAQADAAELAEWRKLSEAGIKKPEDVNALITERDTFKGREEARAKTELRDKAATAAGYDPAKFAALKGVDDWQYEVKTEKQDGKDVPLAYVVSKDEKGVETRKSLNEVVSETFPALADSIKAGESPGGSTLGGAASGARHVQQGSGGASGAGSKFDQIRNANKQEAEVKKQDEAKPLEEIMHMTTNQSGF
jgi:hypothetical protein